MINLDDYSELKLGWGLQDDKPSDYNRPLTYREIFDWLEIHGVDDMLSSPYIKHREVAELYLSYKKYIKRNQKLKEILGDD